MLYLRIGLYPLHQLIVGNRALRCAGQCQLAIVTPNFDPLILAHIARPFLFLPLITARTATREIRRPLLPTINSYV